MKRVEKDPEGGWIARKPDGSMIPDADFRWNSRSAARGAVEQTDLLERDEKRGAALATDRPST